MARRKCPDWWDQEAREADKLARFGCKSTTKRPGGVLAHFDGFCWSCDRQIVRNESRVMPRKGSWICASHGAGDEE